MISQDILIVFEYLRQTFLRVLGFDGFAAFLYKYNGNSVSYLDY